MVWILHLDKTRDHRHDSVMLTSTVQFNTFHLFLTLDNAFTDRYTSRL